MTVYYRQFSFIHLQMISCMLFSFAQLRFVKRRPEFEDRVNVPKARLLGVAQLVYYIFNGIQIQLQDPVIYSVSKNNSIPITAVIQYIVLGIKINFKQFVGIVIVFIGVIFHVVAMYLLVDSQKGAGDPNANPE